MHCTIRSVGAQELIRVLSTQRAVRAGGTDHWSNGLCFAVKSRRTNGAVALALLRLVRSGRACNRNGVIRRAIVSHGAVDRIHRVQQTVRARWTDVAGCFPDFILVRARSTRERLAAVERAVATSRAQIVSGQRTSTGRAEAAGQTRVLGVNSSVVRTVESSRAGRTLCHTCETV